MHSKQILEDRLTLLVWAVFLLIACSTIRAHDLDPKQARMGREHIPQTAVASNLPAMEYAIHNRGNLQLAIANNGTFGTEGAEIADSYTGEAIPSCVYPKNSDVVYLWVGAIWIGAVVGMDTLVSTADEDWYQYKEFWPDVEPIGKIEYKSIDINSKFYDPDAYSEQDFICEYTDTLTDPGIVGSDPFDLRPHKPLGVKVTQRTMAWSYGYADDFILFDYQITNIGRNALKEVYVGIFVDGDVWHVSRKGPGGWEDDMVGFYGIHPSQSSCGCPDTVNVAWTADNDGDPVDGAWNDSSATSIVGARVVRTPGQDLKYSFNWWITAYTNAANDFGPRMAGTPQRPFRNMGTRLGTPVGDRNKYYVMSNQEFDYDLLRTAVDHSDEGYLRPPQGSEGYADGWDTRYLLSFGPFSIQPGENLPLSLAWVAGANLHRDPSAFTNFDPYAPDGYYSKLDFSNLAQNSRWASWVYDNPGVDTDGDGFRGSFVVCQDDPENPPDTIYCVGDGVPDFNGAGPPVAPVMKVFPSQGELVVRFNGYYTENTPDVFSQQIDFEGYRVYVSRDDRPSSFSVVSSYDLEDYNRWISEPTGSGYSDWLLRETPFSLDSLRIIYDDSLFTPLIHTRSHPLTVNDTMYFFDPQDFNAAGLGYPGSIRKVYPHEPRPSTDRTSWTDDMLVDHYREPLPKFYEYEYVISDLLPTVEYYVSVTAFDFGSPIAGLPAMESPPLNNSIRAYPQSTAATVVDRDLDTYVYPNPYRIDGGYRDMGMEGRRETDRSDDRVRELHFVNLPPKCKISIFSLDGDLIRAIDHNMPPDDPKSGHDSWDLITRNTQAVVSGLYYWVVESEERTQIGKFVVIQ